MDYMLLRHRDIPKLNQIDVFMKEDGFEGLKKALKMDTADVTNEVKAAGLRGRGGAGFPAGVKWSFMDNNNWPHYVVANADESEPGTFKDREIMESNPFQFLEGIAIASYAVGANAAYIYLRGEFWEVAHFLDEKIEEMEKAGFLGENIQGTDYSLKIYTHLGAGAYICGEETALLESLEGKKGLPRFKPPFPAQVGAFGRPTTINNTETLASIPPILRKGAQWFSDLGVKNSGGSKIFSVSGHVNRPGNYEVPMGIPFAELLELAGGVLDGRSLKAVIPGGSSVPVLPAEQIMTCTMDYDGLAKAGSALGAGSVIVMDESTCMVQVLERISYFYFVESCGQCTPCREGTGWLYRMLKRIRSGHGTPGDLDRLKSVADRIEGRTICALGDAAAWPVQSFLKHFRHEFEAMIPSRVAA